VSGHLDPSARCPGVMTCVRPSVKCPARTEDVPYWCPSPEAIVGACPGGAWWCLAEVVTDTTQLRAAAAAKNGLELARTERRYNRPHSARRGMRPDTSVRSCRRVVCAARVRVPGGEAAQGRAMRRRHVQGLPGAVAVRRGRVEGALQVSGQPNMRRVSSQAAGKHLQSRQVEMQGAILKPPRQ
jgi:hypothetical protein